MDAEDRDPTPALRPFTDAARRMGFFRLVTLLERTLRPSAGVGLEGPPREEQIRFRHDSSLAFAAGDVTSVVVDAKERAYVTTTFLGLTGSSSPLPLYMAEEIEHEDDETPTRRDFLDLFHHRLVSLFYRAVVRYAPAVTHASNQDDVWLRRMLALSAVQLGDERVTLPPGRLLRLVPLLVRRGRGARTLRLALEVMLEGWIGDARVEVRELAGRWSPIDEGRWVRLGARNHALGQLMLGQKTPDPGGRFVIAIGPLDAAARAGFERGGRALAIVQETVRLVLRTPMTYDLELQLEPEAVRPMKLGKEGRLGTDARIGGAAQRSETIVLRDVDATPASRAA